MSKSGSKALSKSVDASVKSVVKSVESVVSSVVPKNMNMKHVLLAILVGLLLCMLMGNTVEGYTCALPATLGQGASVNASAAAPSDGTTWNAADATEAQYLTAEIPKYTCETGVVDVQDCTADGQPYQVNCIETSAACTATSGPFQSDGNPCDNFCNVAPPNGGNARTITTTSGICSSDFNLPIQKNLCSGKRDKTSCEDSEGCKWTLFSGDEGLFGSVISSDPIHMRGLFNSFMELAGFSKPGCPASHPTAGINPLPDDGVDAMNTKILPLIIESQYSADDLSAPAAQGAYPDWVTLKGGPGNADLNVDKYKDFFSLLFGSRIVDPPSGARQPMSTIINGPAGNILPADLKKQLYDIVLKEEQLWDSLEKAAQDSGKTLFNKNGGRIIAGYDETHGLVIRNSAAQPTLLPSSNPRVHMGAGCPGSWDKVNKVWISDVSCRSDAQCISDSDMKDAINEDQVAKFPFTKVVIPYGDATIRNYCNLDSCAQKFGECKPDKLFADIKQASIGNFAAIV